MKKIMIKHYLAFTCVLLLALSATKPLAQTWADGTAECLGPTMPMQPYAEEIMRRVQANLEIVYQRDAEWLRDIHIKTLRGTALHDGVMGPVTWRWMNRFCGDFWLTQEQDTLERLPAHLDKIASFSLSHPRELSVLIGRKFLDWVNHQPDNVAIKQILLHSDEQQLLALVARYETLPVKPAAKVTEAKTPAGPSTLYRYVLRKDDFEDFAKPKAASAPAPELSAVYDSPEKLKVAIYDVIAKLPPAQQQSAKQPLEVALASPEVVYQLTEARLKSLNKEGLTAFEFVELNKLAKANGNKIFTDKDEFAVQISKALTTATDNLLRSTSTSSIASATSSAAAEPEMNDNLMVADQERINILVVDAAKGYRLQGDAVKQLSNSNTVMDPLIIKAISKLQDMEYPDGELLHLAAIDKLAQALNLCDENESVSIDIDSPIFSPEEQQGLAKLFSHAHFDATEKPRRICNANFWEGLKADYNTSVAPAVTERYMERVPAYQGNDIQWTGDECGCIPDEIKATAYGIYPFWGMDKESPYSGDQKPLNFDFSTFSRVGYYGFSFNAMGELTQPGFDEVLAAPGSKTAPAAVTKTDSPEASNKEAAGKIVELFDLNSHDKRKFISVARKFGSKVDWVIEKDWSEENQNPSHVHEVLNNLQRHIVELLAAPLKTPEERWRHVYTLGIAKPPTLGDGVTLYFKNYPDDPESKQAFIKFFTGLKGQLQKISDHNNRVFREKQEYFVNLVVNQDDYLNPDHLFGSTSIFNMINVPYHELANKTALAEQAQTKTLVLVLVQNPYFNSLQTLFAKSTATLRAYVLPTLIIDYKNFSTGVHTKGDDKRSFYDERRKVVSYQREAFGGGGYWYMPTWDTGAKEFNHYIADNFALDYPANIWYSTICANRWLLVGIMNLWLLSALLFVLMVFYVYPHRCHSLPAIIEKLINPVVLMLLIVPPFIIWGYLKTMDSLFPWISLPSVLLVALLLLSVFAAINWIEELKRQKPSRSLAQLQTANALPKREQLATPKSELQDEENREG